MDYLRTAMEIGVCETVACVADVESERLLRRASNYIPRVADEEMAMRLGFIADSLIDMGVDRLLILGPELDLIEVLAKKRYGGKLYVCLARELDGQSKGRIAKNVPPGIEVEFIDEGEYPPQFLPSNSAIVAFGFGGVNTASLPGYQHRQLEYYRNFSGPIVLACVAPAEQGERPLGWVAGSTFDTFKTVIC